MKLKMKAFINFKAMIKGEEIVRKHYITIEWQKTEEKYGAKLKENFIAYFHSLFSNLESDITIKIYCGFDEVRDIFKIHTPGKVGEFEISKEEVYGEIQS